jgi:hypothetical protein
MTETEEVESATRHLNDCLEYEAFKWPHYPEWVDPKDVEDRLKDGWGYVTEGTFTQQKIRLPFLTQEELIKILWPRRADVHSSLP